MEMNLDKRLKEFPLFALAKGWLKKDIITLQKYEEELLLGKCRPAAL